MNKEYQEIEKELDEEAKQMEELWEADLIEEELKDRNLYEFAENNQYSDNKDPLALYKEFIDLGKINDAILSLEAHLQKN